MRKLTISFRLLLALFAVLSFYQIAFSQIETNSAPARWEYYSGKDKKVSFLLPRLPVYISGGDACAGESTEIYAAYHDGVVYRVEITSMIEPPKLCFQNKRNFDESNFRRRLADLEAQWKPETKSGNNISGDSVIKLTGNNKIIKLINDYENKRWFELTVYGADENKTEVKNFLDSLKNNSQTTGIPIGQGADRTYGDEVSGDTAEIKTVNNMFQTETKSFEEIFTDISVKIKDTSEKPIIVALKPRASYTDAARRASVQGKVVLKVSFMGNGAIGKVAPMSELPNGLTEQAIRAARRIVFVPPQKDGKRYSTVKTVEYGFSIY